MCRGTGKYEKPGAEALGFCFFIAVAVRPCWPVGCFALPGGPSFWIAKKKQKDDLRETVWVLLRR